jgi:HupE / UreJ protein
MSVVAARVLRSVAVLIFGLPATLGAHDIPSDLTIRAFLKPEGQQLHLLIRVPLQAMRDIDYPRRAREYVDLARADQSLRDATNTWIVSDIELYEGEALLPGPTLVSVRASLPSDDSFRSYETALAHLTGPRLADDTEFVWNQGLLDVWLTYPIQSEASRFSINVRWGRLGVRTVTALRLVAPGGAIRAFELVGDPGLVQLDPRWHQAAIRFVVLGFFHILDGTDHLLFLLCLVIPFRRLRPLIAIVTAFTVAHSITLLASAYDLAPGALWFPPLIETLIATSIVYMAFENIVMWNPTGLTRGRESTPEAEDLRSRVASEGRWGPASVRRRWMIAFGFGLVHGFGFSFALRETLQFAGSHLLTSLVAFNVGVELGQILVIALLVPAIDLLFRFVVAERTGTIILSALVAHTGWHWMSERFDRLRQYSFEWPTLTAALLLTVMRWLTLAVILTGIAWLLLVFWRQPKSGARTESGLEVKKS